MTTIIVIALLAGRALLRFARGGALIPQPRLDERWDVAVLVTGTSLFGNFLAVNMVIAINQIIARGKDGDGLAGILFFIVILYAITLLCGELVLIGRHRPALRTV